MVERGLDWEAEVPKRSCSKTARNVGKSSNIILPLLATRAIILVRNPINVKNVG